MEDPSLDGREEALNLPLDETMVVDEDSKPGSAAKEVPPAAAPFFIVDRAGGGEPAADAAAACAALVPIQPSATPHGINQSRSSMVDINNHNSNEKHVGIIYDYAKIATDLLGVLRADFGRVDTHRQGNSKAWKGKPWPSCCDALREYFRKGIFQKPHKTMHPVAKQFYKIWIQYSSEHSANKRETKKTRRKKAMRNNGENGGGPNKQARKAGIVFMMDQMVDEWMKTGCIRKRENKRNKAIGWTWQTQRVNEVLAHLQKQQQQQQQKKNPQLGAAKRPISEVREMEPLVMTGTLSHRAKRSRRSGKYHENSGNAPEVSCLGSNNRNSSRCYSGNLLVATPLVVSNDVSTLLNLLPSEMTGNLSDAHIQESLSDIVLDKGRQAFAWLGGRRIAMGDSNKLVTCEDIASIVNKLGGFGPDNRAGLESQLHRISAVRNRQQDIIGLTMRVGRHVTGAAAMISDLLFTDPTKSILFVGPPGSGKTTIIRDATRLLAERYNTIVVDTSNEIAGDGDIPHACVGQARRIMVPSLQKQGGIMVECVQNHTPDVLVLDEIGRPAEVDAARTCRQRGVRLLASAHGNLRALLKNHELQSLVGGMTTVILGDIAARSIMERRRDTTGHLMVRPSGASQRGNIGGGFTLPKLQAQRAGQPVFDMIVELHRGAFHDWRVVLDTGTAVDQILDGKKYSAQRRTRNPMTGTFQVEFEKA